MTPSNKRRPTNLRLRLHASTSSVHTPGPQLSLAFSLGRAARDTLGPGSRHSSSKRLCQQRWIDRLLSCKTRSEPRYTGGPRFYANAAMDVVKPVVRLYACLFGVYVPPRGRINGANCTINRPLSSSFPPVPPGPCWTKLTRPRRTKAAGY